MGDIGKGTQNVTVNIRKDVVEALDLVAAQAGRSRNKLIAQIIEEAILSGDLVAQMEAELEQNAAALAELRKKVKGLYPKEEENVLKVAEEAGR